MLRPAAWLLGAALVASCSSGSPVAATDAGGMDAVDVAVAPACAAPQMMCGSRCVDPQTDPTSCGACGRACGAGMICAAGSCQVSCPAGATVCNGTCVNAQTDNAHCGACGRACAAGQVCSLGVCGTTCGASLATCAGSASGDAGGTAFCADLANDRLNCGSCGAACAAGSICVNRACQVSCAASQTQCGGACVDLQASNAHCGACGNACPSGQVCSRGACSTTCATPLVSCTNAGSGASFCANTAIDPANCGVCGNACSLPGAAASGCAGGVCTVQRCVASTGDCDGMAANGCEANLATSATNCGACGRVCNLPNATSSCTSGTCSVTACSPSFLDCDGSVANGCEVRSLTDNANCGACDRACPSGQVCSAGACVTTCAAPLTLCSGGCVNRANDPMNCGACGTACAARPNTTPVCAAGACAFVCAPGFADCDRNPANGCEVNLLTSASSCGACGVACPSRSGSTSVCAAGSCGFVCNAGTADCDGNASNGCEASTASPTSCGACGVVCPTRAGSAPVCAAGACGSVCLAGFGDCDANPANGCEVNLASNASHCGACGMACPSGRACSAGACLNSTSCRAIKLSSPAAPSGVYSIDPDGAGGAAPFNVYCEMTTDGGGWTVMAYIRSNAQWDIATFADSGTVGDVTGGFAQGATLAASAATFTERIIIYRRLMELGTDLGLQWMETYRQDGVPTRYSGYNVSSGWGYRDSFGYVDSTVNNACSHGCTSFRGLGMFHDSESGFGYSGTQTGNYGCVDGNNICWVQRSLGCNVGSQRCSLLSGAGEGVIYGAR